MEEVRKFRCLSKMQRVWKKVMEMEEAVKKKDLIAVEDHIQKIK